MSAPLVRVAAVNDYELIVAGVARMLEEFPDRLDVRDRIVIGDPIEGGPIDVALYDTYGRIGIAEPALRALVADPQITAVVVFSLDFPDQLVTDSLAAGADGFISKALAADAIADAIVRVAAGERVAALPPAPRPALEALDWPGKDDGLTERQSQVLVLLAEGLTNQEIADSLYLSIETVKNYLRSVYAKLEFRNRATATAYVHRSGAFTRYQPADPP